MLATLAERELTGATASAGSRCRSPRSGSNRDWTKGDPITAIVLDWGKQQQRQARSGRKPKLLRLLCRVLAKLAADKGFRFQPEPNGPTVQAVYGKELLAAFAEHYHVTGDAKQKRQKRWVAYHRGMKAAVANALVGVRDDLATGEEIIWARK